jgi:glycosyltransferase involved in cell wall biosynthesis
MTSGMSAQAANDAIPEVSVVAPVFNEEAAAPALAREIAEAFAGRDIEIIFVDDASDDGTRQALLALKPELPGLRVLWHGRNAGQSRAIRTGVLAARAPIVVTLDGDGQNDPADAPALVEALRAAGPTMGLVGGERRERRDVAARRWASGVANAVRRRVLDDGAVDTGCGLKALHREVFLRLPYFDHMHRYLPALVLREGYGIAFQPVSHRPRLSGRSKYTNLGRLLAALPDLCGVLWLRGRARDAGPLGEG